MKKASDPMPKSTTSNSKPSIASEAREEGELSSSDNETQDVPHVCSTTPALVAPPISSSSPPQTNFNLEIQPEKIVGENNISTSVDILPQRTKNATSQKTPHDDQVKTVPSAWGASKDTNLNLVISFSDDSGSDLDEHGKKKRLKSHSLDVRPTNSLSAKSYKIHKIAANPLSSSHSSITAMTKNHGENSKGAGASLAGKASRSRNVNVHRNPLSQGRGNNPGKNTTSSKLQDLREQIAIRESKLKLKSAQLSKEIVSVTHRDNNMESSKNDLGSKGNAMSSQFPSLELKEPDVKRLKISGSYCANPNLGGQRDPPVISAAKSVSPPPESGAETQNTRKVTYSQKEIPTSREDLSLLKQKKKVIMPVDPSLDNAPRGVEDGTDIVDNCNQSYCVSKQMDSVASLGQTALLPNMASDDKSHDDNAKFDGQSDGLQPSVSAAKTLEGTCPESASNLRIPEPFNNFFKSMIVNGNSGNAFGNLNCSSYSNFDLQSLFEMEECLEKQLEEAQDFRRQCEVEERNAFKTYCRAQRTLVEANARCLDLYQKRELYSAQLRSFCMNNPSLVSSSRQHEDFRTGVDHSNSMSENANRVSPSYLKHSEYNCSARLKNDLNVQHKAASPINGSNMLAESCIELRDNTLNKVPFRGKNAADRICPPSTDPNVSVDGYEESIPSDCEMIDSYDEFYTKKKHVEDDLKKNNPIGSENTEDSILLEAKLRSELFARLGRRKSSKACSSRNIIQPSVEQGAVVNDARGDKADDTEMIVRLPVGNVVEPRSEEIEINNGSDSLSQMRRDQHFGFGGTVTCKTSSEIQDSRHLGNFLLESDHLAESDVNKKFNGESRCCNASFSFTHFMSLNSVFQHLKAISLVGIEVLLTSPQGRLSNFGFREGTSLKADQVHRNILKQDYMNEDVGYMFDGDGSYIHNTAVDPFWPLCMYELRGKCNNDECPWQHIKDYSAGNQRQCQDEQYSCDALPLARGKTEGFQYDELMTPPTYLVGNDILKADSHPHDSVVVRKNGQCWQTFFSISLVLPNLLQKDAAADGLFLHDARIEAKGSWNRQSSYFQSGSTAMSQLKQADEDQTLETVLLILNQEVNKGEGMKKALSVLSRAVENSATSAALWIIYLLLFHSYTKLGDKDDMFTYAVKHNQQSYELWLMYINSRVNLNDRLAAYDAALSALCRDCFTHDSDGKHASACILDLILQMTNCLYMSGDVDKAIQGICGLFKDATDSNSDKPNSFTHSDILSSLNISDKCVFWVCVVYLVIYEKLPDAVVQQFECEKELDEIEWTTIQLKGFKKQQASMVIKEAVKFVESCLINESLGSKRYCRSVQMFAVNHVRCLMAFDGIENTKNLLDKYCKLHPYCLELVLLLAQVHDSGNETVVVFEEALRKWPEEVPGVQCIWNQYAEYLLQSGRIEYAKELMMRWFQSAWKVDHSQTGILNNNDCNSGHLLDYAADMDVVFQYLNLSVHKLLQNDQLEARLAFDDAMRAASLKTFKYCMREYSLFLLTDECLLKEAASIGGLRSMLESHLNDVRAFPVCKPLSRKFIDSIKRPRVRQLVSSMLSTLSPDVSLINCILEAWYGPTLLPPKFSKPKELVDFVETVMEIFPSNYQLAISVCRHISKGNEPFQVSSASLIFWASSKLTHAIFSAVPIPPEFIWVEVANILVNVKGFEAITERFLKRALSVYRFSVQLWKSYYTICESRGDTSANAILQEVKEKGIELT